MLTLSPSYSFQVSPMRKRGQRRPNPPVLRELTTEFPKDSQLEARVLTATLAPGATSPWHTHATSVVVYVLESTFTLEFKDREPIHRLGGSGACTHKPLQRSRLAAAEKCHTSHQMTH